MYELKQEKREELQDGRTISWLCILLNLTQGHLNNLLLGKNPISKSVAMCLISAKERIYITDSSMTERLDYYFYLKDE